MNKFTLLPFFVALICSWIFSTITAAGIVSVSGEIIKISPPPTVEWEALESSQHAFVFQESAGVVLTSPILMDVIPFQANPLGVYDDGSLAVQNTWKGDLGIGSYDSFYFHADKQGANETFVGSITFDADIAGIAFRQNLNPTRPVFGNPGTDYPTGSTKNYELTRDDCWFSISNDLRTLSFSTYVPHDLDQLRVVTMASSEVPSPSSFTVFAMGLGGMLWRSRRR